MGTVGKRSAKKTRKPGAVRSAKRKRGGRVREKAAVEPQVRSQGIWSGTVSFSLVAIPVRLVRAVGQSGVSFRMLHSKDYSPLRRRMFCPAEEKIVDPDEIVRGFELEPGRHLVITEKELESVSPERSRTIEIAEFADAAEIDPVYFDHPYYLTPLKGGEKSYRLLAEAMARTGKAGIAKFVLDEREYLVAVRSRGGSLLLSTLHYSSEVLPATGIAPAGAAADEKEKESFKNSIRSMAAPFDPAKYSDDRKKKLAEILEKKIEGKRQVEAPETGEEEAEGITDLVASLERSMASVKKG